jgi:hypothetical protein
MTTTPADRRPPEPATECPLALDAAALADITAALMRRHGQRLPPGESMEIAGHVGAAAAMVVVVVSEGRRHREVFAFARGRGAGLDGPLGVVVDVIDDVLGKVVAVERPALPLDWTGQVLGTSTVFVRGELRDYAAEEAAAVLLDEPPPPRAIAPFAND